MSKRLEVTVKVEMDVPDEWELAETSGGIQVLKTGDKQFLEFMLEPIFADDPNGTWRGSDSDDKVNSIVDMIDAEESVYEFVRATLQ